MGQNKTLKIHLKKNELIQEGLCEFIAQSVNTLKSKSPAEKRKKLDTGDICIKLKHSGKSDTYHFEAGGQFEQQPTVFVNVASWEIEERHQEVGHGGVFLTAF